MLCSRLRRDEGEHGSMNHGSALALAVLACGLVPSAHATDVVLCTDRGRAVLELADEQAPLHVANFLRYVDSGYYSGMVFHRVLRGLVVQGGGVDRRLRGRPTFAPVKSETANGIPNARGTVAAARGNDPDSATAQFFVNLNDNTQLDGGRSGGYTVFGRVKEGIAIFDEIGRAPTGSAGPFKADVPTPLVAIHSAARHDEQALAALPAEGRDALLMQQIAAATAANDAAEGLRLIGLYRAATCAADAEVSLTEARLALARDERQRAAFVLENLLATTPATDASYAAATELYRAALRVVRECEPSLPPPIPDATVAAAEEMVAAQQRVREFVTAGEAYLACLSTVIDDEERSADDRNLGVTEHNRMVSVMEETAAAFNEQIRVFRGRR